MPCLPSSFSMSFLPDSRDPHDDVRRRSPCSSLLTEEASRGNKSLYGRGGTGNIGDSSSLDLVSLDTPNLSGDTYNAGRRGKRNMAHSNDPATVRRARDLTGYPLYHCTSNSHINRGGPANVLKPSKEDILRANRDRLKREVAAAAEKNKLMMEEKKPRGLANVGKDWLFRSTNIKDIRRRSRGSATDNNLTILFAEKKPIGLADRGKDWIFGRVSGLVSGRK